MKFIRFISDRLCMRPKSEFQQILEAAMSKNSSADSGAGNGFDAFENSFRFFEIQFERVKAGDWQTKWKYREQTQHSGRSAEFQEAPRDEKKQDSKSENCKQTHENQREHRNQRTDEPPKNKMKRRLTFDQKQALRIFHFFGETSLSDISDLSEIKGAYRRLAKKYHPDCNSGSDLHFKKIASAYQKLIFGWIK